MKKMVPMLTLFFGLAALGLVALCATAMAQAPALPQDLENTLLSTEATQQDWPLYGGNYKAWRYSGLTQINKQNVKDLQVAWKMETGMVDAFEASPIVINGVMYITTPWNHVMAVDAKTGAGYWRYAHPLPKSLPLCCGAVNRGAAVGRGKVFFATLDCQIVALDAQTGKVAWQTKSANYKEGYSYTVAPIIVGNMVVVGASGGDFGVRGFIDAYDADSGKQIWRFWTIPGPGEFGHDSWEGNSWKTGGGPVWMPITYDKQTNTIFAGVGNPGPDLDGSNRKGDNLYTESSIALDANTGKLKWYFQQIPHDVWDLDNVTEQVIEDLTIDGKQYQTVLCASKNGHLYVMDRNTGKCIYALQFAHKVNFGTVKPDGSVTLNKDVFPVQDRWVKVWPGASGGKEWCPVAYDPQRKRLFIPAIELPHLHRVIKQKFRSGLNYWGGVSEPAPGEGYGHVVAIDVEKKAIAWDMYTEYPVVSGITCTASGLVIAGTPDQKMLIYDADNGNLLHTFRAPSGWHSAPVVYEADGTEYIAFANGWGGWVTGYDDTGTPKLVGMPRDNTMFVFSLPASAQSKGGAQAQAQPAPPAPEAAPGAPPPIEQNKKEQETTSVKEK